MSKPAFPYADQLFGTRAADRHVCVRVVIAIPLSSKYEISSLCHLLCLYTDLVGNPEYRFCREAAQIPKPVSLKLVNSLAKLERLI